MNILKPNSFYTVQKRCEAIKWFNDNFDSLPRDKNIYLIQFEYNLSSGIKKVVKNGLIKAKDTNKFYNRIANGIKNSEKNVLDLYITEINYLMKLFNNNKNLQKNGE